MWKQIDIVGFQSYSTENVIITKFVNDTDILYTIDEDDGIDHEPKYYIIKTEDNNKIDKLIQILKTNGESKMDGLNLIGPKFYTILSDELRSRILCSFDKNISEDVTNSDYFKCYIQKTYDEIFSYYVDESQFFPRI